MNDVKVFESPEFGSIRTFTDNGGKLWFCGSDVAKGLGYARPSKAIIDHCKGVLKRDTPTNGGIQSLSYISEGDVYRLIIHSKLPSAEHFENWVFDEIVPSVIKTGGYIVGQESMSDADLMAKALLVAQRQIEQRQQQIDTLQAENARLLPDAKYGRDLQASNGITTTSIAKEFCMSARALNGLLHGLGIQYKQSGQWLLYSRYHGKGLTTTRTIPITRSDGRKDVKRETVWTMKGHRFICDKLAEQGIFPNEQSAEG